MTYVSVRSYTVYRGEKVLFQGSLILVRLDSLDMYTLHEVNTKVNTYVPCTREKNDSPIELGVRPRIAEVCVSLFV
jgi:hypothetical protein